MGQAPFRYYLAIALPSFRICCRRFTWVMTQPCSPPRTSCQPLAICWPLYYYPSPGCLLPSRAFPLRLFPQITSLWISINYQLPLTGFPLLLIASHPSYPAALLRPSGSSAAVYTSYLIPVNSGPSHIITFLRCLPQ